MPLEPRDRHGVLRLFGRELLQMRPTERASGIDRAVAYWRRRGFPYPRFSASEMAREFHCLAQVSSAAIVTRNVAGVSMIGLRLANAFHPQMWSIPVHGRSPLDCFRDDEALRRALTKAPSFWPGRRCWNAQCVRTLMRIHHRARVSNFRPTVARAVYARYANEGVVLDFSAGFGGRLLASLTLKQHYIGIDPAAAQVRGLRRMTRRLQSLGPGTAEIHQACAEDFLPSLPARSIDLVFSSPPYFNLERYSRAPTQSYRRYPTYEAWKTHFLATLIAEAHRVLRPGGFFVLNVADIPRYPLVQDARAFAAEGFELSTIIRMLLRRMPRQHSHRATPYRWEPLFVFRKPVATCRRRL